MSEGVHKLYDHLAWLWPLLSPPEDYQGEAAGVHGLIQDRLAAAEDGARPALLELGSGGGHMLCHLQAWYDIIASDLSQAMLMLSSELNPHITHVQADMRTLRLGDLFDVVLIHDALGYMVTLQDLDQAITTAALHLRPSGVLVLLPDEMRETFVDQQTASDSVRSPDGSEVTLVSHAASTPDASAYDLTMLFLIRQDGLLSIEEDRHHCGLFSRKQWREVLVRHGFEKISIRGSLPWRGSPVLVAQKK